MDAFLMSFTTSGDHLKTTNIGLAGGVDYDIFGNVNGLGVGTDSAGNVYITGYSSRETGNTDVMSQLGILVDGVFTPISDEVLGSNNAFVTKFDSDLTPQFTKIIGAIEASFIAGSIVVQSDGGFFITGYANQGLDGKSITGEQDAFIMKYNSSGNKDWTQFLGFNDSITFGLAIAKDSIGDLFIAGMTQSMAAPDASPDPADGFVGKLSSQNGDLK